MHSIVTTVNNTLSYILYRLYLKCSHNKYKQKLWLYGMIAVFANAKVAILEQYESIQNKHLKLTECYVSTISQFQRGWENKNFLEKLQHYFEREKSVKQ